METAVSGGIAAPKPGFGVGWRVACWCFLVALTLSAGCMQWVQASVGSYDRTAVARLEAELQARFGPYEALGSDNGWMLAESLLQPVATTLQQGTSLFERLYANGASYQSCAADLQRFTKSFEPLCSQMEGAVAKTSFVCPSEVKGFALAGRMGEFVKGLIVAAVYYVHHGRWDRALASYMLGERMMARLEAQGSLEVLGDRRLLQAAWMRQIPQWRHAVDAVFFRESLQQISQVPDTRHAFADALDFRYLQEVHSFGVMLGEVPPNPDEMSLADRPAILALVRPILNRDRRLLQKYFLSIRPVLSLDYVQGHQQMAQMQRRFEAECSQKLCLQGPYQMNRCMNCDVVYAGAESNEGALRLLNALYAFRADRGHFPSTPAALVPGYLSALPRDPFSPAGRYGYALKGDDFTLYSFGPDGFDHGGYGSVSPSQVSHETVGDVIFH